MKLNMNDLFENNNRLTRDSWEGYAYIVLCCTDELKYTLPYDLKIYICRVDINQKNVWTPSQADLLADDWRIL